jgi:hypothetical protein
MKNLVSKETFDWCWRWCLASSSLPLMPSLDLPGFLMTLKPFSSLLFGTIVFVPPSECICFLLQVCLFSLHLQPTLPVRYLDTIYPPHISDNICLVLTTPQLWGFSQKLACAGNFRWNYLDPWPDSLSWCFLHTPRPPQLHLSLFIFAAGLILLLLH